MMSGSSWDPFELDNFTPTRECLQRIRSDLKELKRNPLPGIYCVPDDLMVNKFHAVIVGPFDTPYEGGFFYFVLCCPASYPADPPMVKLLTTGGGRVRFNPNLYSNGKVCLSILGTWSGPSWTPVQTLSSVLLSIQSLMSEKPYHNEPGFESPNNLESDNYNHCIRHETLRVAVCEMASKSSSMASLIPPVLKEVIHSLFPNFMESYELTCVSNKFLDGQAMIDPFGEKRGVFNYDGIMKQLVVINESILTDCCEFKDESNMKENSCISSST